MEQNLELLREIALFAEFPLQARKLLAFLAQRGQLEEGATVFEKGDDFGQGYILLTGTMALFSDPEQQEIRRFYPGDFVGSFALLGPLPALFELRAQTDCTVLTLTRHHFAKILEQFPQTSKLYLRAALQELHQWERKNLTEAKTCCLERLGATIL